MLVRVTEKCTMQCPHCMVNAQPDGRHMTQDVYKQVLLFILRGNMPFIMLSGGEPTEHPEIFDLLEYARRRRIQTYLLSNGEFLHRKGPMTGWILESVSGVQVTNDPQFYPRRVEKFDHPKVSWETKLRVVSPHGRARTNGLSGDRAAPECFNLRSLTRGLQSFSDARLALAGRGRFCTPSVDVDGTIRAGESSECTAIGRVTDDEATLTRNVASMRCSACGLVNNLDKEHKEAIGE